MPYEIPDYVAGRTVKDGEPLPVKPEQVTVVTPDEADDVFGTRTHEERTRLLRGYRDLGLLVTSRGRLTARVKTGRTTEKGWAEKANCYVFRCAESELPRKRPRRPRVHAW
jgi:hypothetical protein